MLHECTCSLPGLISTSGSTVSNHAMQWCNRSTIVSRAANHLSTPNGTCNATYLNTDMRQVMWRRVAFSEAAAADTQPHGHTDAQTDGRPDDRLQQAPHRLPLHDDRLRLRGIDEARDFAVGLAVLWQQLLYWFDVQVLVVALMNGALQNKKIIWSGDIRQWDLSASNLFIIRHGHVMSQQYRSETHTIKTCNVTLARLTPEQNWSSYSCGVQNNHVHPIICIVKL